MEIVKGIDNVKQQIISKLTNKYINNIAITFHNAPDGDAIGSAVGLALALQNMGKTVIVFTNGFSDLFTPIMKHVNCRKRMRGTFDLTILLDCSNRRRTINYIDDLSKYLIVVDHHMDSKPIGNLYLCENKASTSIIIYDILKQMDVYIDKKIATALYLGIVGDTAWFSNFNMSAEVHLIAGKLLQYGADLNIINDIYKTKSIGMLKLIADIFSQIVICKEYKIAYAVLMLEDLNKYNLKYDVSEYLINEIKNIRDIDVAFLFIESKVDTRIKARSKNNIYVNKIMEYFDGGGHRYAAGAVVDSLNIYYIVDTVVSQTKSYIDKLNAR